MMALLSGLLKAAGGLVPGLGPTAFIALALVFSHTMIGGYGYMRGSEGKKEALAKRDLKWTLQLQQERNAHDDALSTARKAAEAELPTPADRAERLRLCKKSPTCRDGGS